MTVAVLIASSPFVPASLLTLFFLCACLASGLLAWCAAATSLPDLRRRLIRASVLGVAVYVVWDCGWLWDWLCVAI